MCGRYSFSTTKAKVVQELGPLEMDEDLELNYNIAPTQMAYVVTNEEPGLLQRLAWGLVPYWSKDADSAPHLINARREGIENKPSFRGPIRKHRCLVLADSFYEWKKEGREKIPYRIHLKQDRLLVMAGIWDIWKGNNREIRSFSIITTTPNKEVAVLHDRMPALLLDREQRQQWLEEPALEAVLHLLEPPPDGVLDIYRVPILVNNVRNNGPSLHEHVHGSE